MKGTKLINKGSIWNSDDDWDLTSEGLGTLVCIQNVSNGKVLSVKEDHLVIEEALDLYDTEQMWKKGKPDSEGYFKLTNPSTKMVLSAFSNHHLKIESKNAF